MHARHEAHHRLWARPPHVVREVQSVTGHVQVVIYAEDGVGLERQQRPKPIVQRVDFVQLVLEPWSVSCERELA